MALARDARPGTDAVGESEDSNTGRGGVPATVRKRPWAWIAGLALLGVVTHAGWFSGGVRTAGDWGYLSAEALDALLKPPQAWDGATGFGQPNQNLSGVPYELAMGSLAALGASYSVAERVIFFFPFAVLPLLSMFWLAGRFTSSNAGRSTAAAIYALNTYILVIGTNQLTVAMAYAFAPFAVGAFFDALTERRGYVIRASLAGLALAIATAYDPRIGYLIAAAFALVAIACVIATRDLYRPSTTLGLALATTVGLHLYWLLPATRGSLRSAIVELFPDDPFISFATMTHAIALNHPFWTGGEPAIFVVQDPSWPLFGLPLVAVAAFLLPRVRRDWRLLTLGGLALLGVFLVKGENRPFGGVYGWAFDTVPGFRLFRDMSKFNLYVALGYAALGGMAAAWSATHIAAAVRSSRSREFASNVVAVQALFLVGLAVGFSAWPAITQQLGNTLEPTEVPNGYARFERLLREDHRFGRVLWLPTPTRFATKTPTHPTVGGSELLGVLQRDSSGELHQELADVATDRSFGDAVRGVAIRYVAIDRLADSASWEAGASDDWDTNRATLRRVLNADSAFRRVVSTAAVDVYRVSGAVHYAEFVPSFRYPVSRARGRVNRRPSFAPERLKTSLNRVHPAIAPAGGTLVLPARFGEVTEDTFTSQPFTIDRPRTFRIDRSGTSAGRDERIAVIDRRGAVVWRGAATSRKRITLGRPGTYRLVVRSSEIDADLLGDGSFERTLWTSLGDALNYDGSSLRETGIAAKSSRDAVAGRRSLRLEAERHIAGISSAFVRVRAGRAAIVRFAWKSLFGPPPAYAPYLGRDLQRRPTPLAGSRAWNSHVDVFTIPSRAEGLAVSFYAGPGGATKPTAALFDDVNVAMIPRWLTELRLGAGSPRTNVPVHTSRDLRRLSATITQRGTYILRVKSTYDDGWRAAFRIRIPRGWIPESRTQHIRTAEGMNAWSIEVPAAPARVDARLTYGPQRWVNVGAIATVLVLLAVLAGLLYGQRKYSKR